MTLPAKILFSAFDVTSQVFFVSKFTFALVNLKPIVPGHVLVVPLRVVSRLKDLSEEESVDYMMTLQKIHSFIEDEYKANSLNIATQDGAAAGQTVPHLHTHIIPRYFADGYGDSIYAELDHHEGALKKFQESLRKPAKLEVADDAARKPRTMEEMKIEAELLRKRLDLFLNK